MRVQNDKRFISAEFHQHPVFYWQAYYNTNRYFCQYIFEKDEKSFTSVEILSYICYTDFAQIFCDVTNELQRGYMTKLFLQAITKLVFGALIAGLLIFLPAGTILFANGWLLMGVLFIPMLVAGIVMMFKSPELLKKRLSAKEKLNEQKTVVISSGFMFVLGFIVAGLTYRFELYILPRYITGVATALFLAGYIIYAEVLRENKYLSRTIEVAENQKVVDTGLYGIVRHPMYFATLLLFLSMPLILGSLYAFVIFLAYPFIIIKRIKSEEEFLCRELPGYSEYIKKVRYRMIPYVW